MWLPTGTWDWVWYGGAAVAALGAMWLLWWGLLRERKRAVSCCPNCWYEMAGVGTCPECGREVRSEKDLHRTRRRWRVALAGVLCLVVSTGVVGWRKAQRDTWWVYVPTWVLIEGLPVAGMESGWADELRTRVTASGYMTVGGRTNRGRGQPMSRDTYLHLLDRCIEGNWLAQPRDERWRASYGQMLQETRLPSRGSSAYPDGTPEDRALQSAFDRIARIPPEVQFDTREQWVSGFPIMLEGRLEHWWTQRYKLRVALRWRIGDGPWNHEHTREQSSAGSCAIRVFIENPPAGEFEVACEVPVRPLRQAWRPFRNSGTSFRLGLAADGHREVSAEVLRFRIAQLESADGLIAPVQDAAIDAHLHQGLRIKLSEFNSRLDPSAIQGGASVGVAVAGDLIAIRDGVERRLGAVVWTMGDKWRQDCGPWFSGGDGRTRAAMRWGGRDCPWRLSALDSRRRTRPAEPLGLRVPAAERSAAGSDGAGCRAVLGRGDHDPALEHHGGGAAAAVALRALPALR